MSYVVPTGTVDDVTGIITMDLSSWFANHMGMNQNLEGIATGHWDSATGLFSDLSWAAILTQGSHQGATVTWTLKGEVLSTSDLHVNKAKYSQHLICMLIQFHYLGHFG